MIHLLQENLILSKIISFYFTYQQLALKLNRYYGWFGVPFAVLLLIFEEVRKKLIRKSLF